MVGPADTIRVVIWRVPAALSLNDLVAVAERSWAEQMDVVFDQDPVHPAQQDSFPTSLLNV